MNEQSLEARLDDVIGWLAENGMITREGESDEVLSRIKERENSTSETEDWQDEMPEWAKTGESVPGLEISKSEIESTTTLSS